MPVNHNFETIEQSRMLKKMKKRKRFDDEFIESHQLLQNKWIFLVFQKFDALNIFFSRSFVRSLELISMVK